MEHQLCFGTFFFFFRKIKQFHNIFNLIQDSLLDGEAVLGNSRTRGLCLSPVTSPLGKAPCPNG